MARDFRAEIAAALSENNIGALAEIAGNLLGRVEADDERRHRQAEKKRLQRLSRDNGGQSRTSPSAHLSRDVPGQAGTGVDIPPVVPPLRSNPIPPPPSAQVIAKLGDVRLQRGLDMLREKFTDEEWEDVASFFLRRKYDRWAEWAGAMLREVGPGSQYEPADLLSVCRDDGTLDKRIGSAGVLRSFLGTARVARVGGIRSPPTGAARPSGRNGSRRDTNPTSDPIAPTDSIEKVKWQT